MKAGAWVIATLAAACRPSAEPHTAADADAGAALRHPDIEVFLDKGWRAAAARTVPAGFRSVTLSNLAVYCVSERLSGAVNRRTALRCLTRLVELGRRAPASPYRGDISEARLDDHGLYLTHFNIVLGAYEWVARDGRFRALNRRLSEHLARRALADPLRHAASYPGVKARWPADQTATLYSLYLYDRNFGGSLSEEPLREWQAVMRERGMNATWGLPRSEMRGVNHKSAHPRGCALSWSVAYMAAFAPEEAAALWERYKEHYLIDTVLTAGFREWPPGVDLPGDIDSGPIVAGVGAAATGLGLAASRAMGDATTYARLKRTEHLVRLAGVDALDRVGDSILARSIALRGDTYVAWDRER